MTHREIKLAEVKDALLYSFASDSELTQTVEVLSENFTTKRDALEEYLNSDKMVSAYACFYLMTNIPKLMEVLNLVNISAQDLEDVDIYDIGAGSGTFSLALLSLNSSLEIKAIEKSKIMQKQGEKFFKKFFPNANVSYAKLNEVQHKTKKRLGIFGHSSNEMGVNVTLDYINKLELDVVLFIEPGTKQFFEQFLIMRKKLLEKYTIKYPCFSEGECPLVENDWCHQYLKLSHSHEVERLSQLVFKDRRNVPISVSLFTLREDDLENEFKENIVARIVRVYTPTKFSVEWQVCYQQDGKNVVVDLQIMTRSYSKKEIKTLREIFAGATIQFAKERELEDNKVRGKLIWKNSI